MRFPKGDKSRYYTQIKVIQYDEFIKRIYIVNLVDAFPVGIAPQPVSWSDDGFHRLSVSFAYQKYETVYEGGYDLGQAATSLLATKGANLVRNITSKIPVPNIPFF